jgi:hypothetical protein
MTTEQLTLLKRTSISYYVMWVYTGKYSYKREACRVGALYRVEKRKWWNSRYENKEYCRRSKLNKELRSFINGEKEVA